MNTDTYHYHLNRTYREDIIRAAHRQQLCQRACKGGFRSLRAYPAVLLVLWQLLFR